MIDVRCKTREPDGFGSSDAGRCQLLAGHEGPHAVMFCRNGQRMVRTWRETDSRTLHDHRAGQEMLPWVLGLPRPAWGERV
jgi:hypothetical protein